MRTNPGRFFRPVDTFISASYSTVVVKLIHTKNLCKKAGERLILDDITLEVSAEQFYGIFGRNGSGKTTLLKCLAGLERPSRGQVLVERKVRRSLALEQPGLARELTLAENLALFASLGRLAPRRRANRIASVMQSLGLTTHKNVRVASLSYGLLARCEIARALVGDSNLVLLDGVIDVLDGRSARQVWQVLFERRREEGTTFVVSTKRAEHAEQCDVVAMLHDGRLLGSGSPSDLKSTTQPEAVIVDAIRNPMIKSKIKKRFAVAVEEVEGMLKFQSADKMGAVLDLLKEYGSEVGAVYLRQPTLDNVLDDLIERRIGSG